MVGRVYLSMMLKLMIHMACVLNLTDAQSAIYRK